MSIICFSLPPLPGVIGFFDKGKTKIMHTYVKYEEGDHRTPVLEMVQYLGFKRSLLVIRMAKKNQCNWAGFNCAVALAGISGRPVTDAWTRWTGQEPNWDDKVPRFF
jgi:hypothetical protein